MAIFYFIFQSINYHLHIRFFTFANFHIRFFTLDYFFLLLSNKYFEAS